jgi:hypothetical protein
LVIKSETKQKRIKSMAGDQNSLNPISADQLSRGMALKIESNKEIHKP